MSRSKPQPDPETQTRPNGAPASRHLPAVFLATICGLVLFEAATTLTEQGYASGTPISNAALYPRLLAGLLLFLLAMQVVADLRATGPTAHAEAQASLGGTGLVAFTGLAIVAYVVLLPVLGFIVATPVLVLGLLLLLGDRRPATLVAVPLAMTAGCMAVFQGLFNVNLPRGLFGIGLNF